VRKKLKHPGRNKPKREVKPPEIVMPAGPLPPGTMFIKFSDAQIEEAFMGEQLERYVKLPPDDPDESGFHPHFHYAVTRYIESHFVKPSLEMAARFLKSTVDTRTDEERARVRPDQPGIDGGPRMLGLIARAYEIPDNVRDVSKIQPGTKFREGVTGMDTCVKDIEALAEETHDGIVLGFLPKVKQLVCAFKHYYDKHVPGDEYIFVDLFKVPEYVEAQGKVDPNPFSRLRVSQLPHPAPTEHWISPEQALEKVRPLAHPNDFAHMERIWELTKGCQMQMVVDVRRHDVVLARAVHVAQVAANLQEHTRTVAAYCAERDAKYAVPPRELVRDAGGKLNIDRKSIVAKILQSNGIATIDPRTLNVGNAHKTIVN
jgi:hypothetical protein